MVENSQMPLYWEGTYEIVLALMETYPDVDLEMVSTEQLLRWVIALPGFADDPELVSDEILNDILREWYEESSIL
jgi:FeS assembly protein IscX